MIIKSDTTHKRQHNIINAVFKSFNDRPIFQSLNLFSLLLNIGILLFFTASIITLVAIAAAIVAFTLNVAFSYKE